MPDLQLRMSKKIAQLTKVIYHLNNKNEDHDMDLAEMADQYESEIETVLRDTADKLNAFQVQPAPRESCPERWEAGGGVAVSDKPSVPCEGGRCFLGPCSPCAQSDFDFAEATGPSPYRPPAWR